MRRNAGCLRVRSGRPSGQSRPNRRRGCFGRTFMRRIAVLAVALAITLAALSLAAAPAGAQAFKPDEADKAAAVKEGNVSWYSSTPFPLVQLLADRFTQDTGVKVTLLRSG